VHKNAEYYAKLLMVAAVLRVVEDLGRQPYSLIEQYLMKVHGLSLRAVDGPGSYSLEQLREGLGTLLGEEAAVRILEDIVLQLDKLSEAMDLTHSRGKRGRKPVA
jgi:hypothetical protein